MTNVIEELTARARQLRDELPSEAQNTSSYPLIPVLMSQGKMETVETPDGPRCRPWAAVVSLSITDSFSDGPINMALFPVQSSEVIDADSREALRARLVHEIDVALQMVDEAREALAKRRAPMSIVQ